MGSACYKVNILELLYSRNLFLFAKIILTKKFYEVPNIGQLYVPNIGYPILGNNLSLTEIRYFLQSCLLKKENNGIKQI